MLRKDTGNCVKLQITHKIVGIFLAGRLEVMVSTGVILLLLLLFTIMLLPPVCYLAGIQGTKNFRVLLYSIIKPFRQPIMLSDLYAYLKLLILYLKQFKKIIRFIFFGLGYCKLRAIQQSYYYLCSCRLGLITRQHIYTHSDTPHHASRHYLRSSHSNR